MKFNITPLMGGSFLVEGTDIIGRTGTTVLHSEAWNALQSIRRHMEAQDIFDAAVEATFANITAAAARASEHAHPTKNNWSRVVLSEGNEGTEREEIVLDDQGVLLRILEETDGSLLRWIGDDSLVAIQA